MRDYFKPFRRKLGVLTLMVACGVAAGWIRSRLFEEGILINPNDKSRMELISHKQVLLCATEWLRDTDSDYHKDDEAVTYVRNISYARPMKPYGVTLWNGFGYARKTFEAQKLEVLFFAIPYWSIVIPLTALSAWLLLSKPRQRNKPEPSQEPAA